MQCWVLSILKPPSTTTRSGCTPTAQFTSPCARPQPTWGRTIKLRIHVTGLDAMCRMIQNGLGVGVMPQRAFELMHGMGELAAVPLLDEWATRDIQLVARDFSTLPVTARLLVEHLTQPADNAAPAKNKSAVRAAVKPAAAIA